MDDLVALVLLASTAFFVTLSFGLLFRYRRVSQRISASTDLGRDLWSALESRMKKQDERILDMMGRLEVVQSRFAERLPAEHAVSFPPQPVSKPSLAPPVIQEKVVTSDLTVTPELISHAITSEITLDDTERSVIQLLGERPRSSVEVKNLIGKTREHAARLMKGLFDAGLVTRNTSNKPFVYQLTERGRRYLAAN